MISHTHDQSATLASSSTRISTHIVQLSMMPACCLTGRNASGLSALLITWWEADRLEDATGFPGVRKR